MQPDYADEGAGALVETEECKFGISLSRAAALGAQYTQLYHIYRIATAAVQ
jgi:hypothetical protein